MEKTAERHVVSFLVRFWMEPRENEQDIQPVRVYIRHLQTGEERYYSDPGMILEYMLRHLRNGHNQHTSDDVQDLLEYELRTGWAGD